MISRRSFLTSTCLGVAALEPTVASAGSRPPLEEFGYGEVSLMPGLAKTQFEHTQALLVSLNEDSLLKPLRLRAGLAAPGPELGGWYDEVPLQKTESGGHGYAPAHSFGQWVSALARGYAVNQDQRVLDRLKRLLALYEPTISGKFYKGFRYPAYNYDKMVIGLLDSHRYANIPNAFRLLNQTTDAAEPWLPPHALDRGEVQSQWRASIGDDPGKDNTRDESYTLPEHLFLAWKNGAGERYRPLAERFLMDEGFFDPLSRNENAMIDRHAYSFFNALNSAAQAYLTIGSEKHLRSALNGFDFVASGQSFATGGWGPNESFSAPQKHALKASLSGTHRGFETPCGSYAHLKLTRYLLRLTQDGRYGDSMERVFYNTILGAKTLEPDGRAFYYSDYHSPGHKSYFPDAWPCCSGTLPQVACDYHLLSYFHDAGGIFVNMYLPSTLHWTTTDGAQFTLTQTGAYPLDGRIALRLASSSASKFAIRLRIPAWSDQSRTIIRVNGNRTPAPITVGFASIDRRWKNGDLIEVDLPLPLRLEPIDSANPDTVALLRGPLVLFALTDNAPQITRGQLLSPERTKDSATWRINTSVGPLAMRPFFAIEDQHYTTYLNLKNS